MTSTPDSRPLGAASPAVSAPTTHQLDFYQAMVDFKVMFPSMDEEIIEAVLRANNGAVDATIDQLLTMSVDTSPESQATSCKVSKARKSPMFAGHTNSDNESFGATATFDPKSSDANNSSKRALLQPPSCTGAGSEFVTPTQTFDPFDDDFFRTPAAPKPCKPGVGIAAVAVSPPDVNKCLVRNKSPRWNPPLVGKLPDDFLRIIIEPPTPPPSGSGDSSHKEHIVIKSRAEHSPHANQSPRSSGTPESQMLEDEMLALYLQNEEFLNDLRRDEDFMRSLRSDGTQDPELELDPNRPKQDKLTEYGDDSDVTLGAFPYDKDVGEQNAELRRQLNNIEGSSKKKLSAMARRFFSRTKKKKSSKQMLKNSPVGPSKTNLLEDEESLEGKSMASLREDSECNLVPSHRTWQRPPYNPDGIVTFDRSDPDVTC